MKITKVQIKIAGVDRTKTRLRAYALVELDEILRINNIRVLEGKEGMFIALPSAEEKIRCKICGGKISPRDQYCRFCGNKKSQDFTRVRYKNLVQFISPKISTEIREKVIEKYKQIDKLETA